MDLTIVYLLVIVFIGLSTATLPRKPIPPRRTKSPPLCAFECFLPYTDKVEHGQDYREEHGQFGGGYGRKNTLCFWYQLQSLIDECDLLTRRISCVKACPQSIGRTFLQERKDAACELSGKLRGMAPKDMNCSTTVCEMITTRCGEQCASHFREIEQLRQKGYTGGFSDAKIEELINQLCKGILCMYECANHRMQEVCNKEGAMPMEHMRNIMQRVTGQKNGAEENTAKPFLGMMLLIILGFLMEQ